jgi:hypothetical protein
LDLAAVTVGIVHVYPLFQRVSTPEYTGSVYLMPFTQAQTV